jgi:hypothetical protein
MAIINKAALETAIENLDARELPDDGRGEGTRYVHFDDAMRAWFCVTAGELELYATDYLESDDETTRSDAYSLWCAATSAQQMPEGWTPAD